MDTRPYLNGEYLLEPEEAALIDTLREQLKNVERLSELAEEDRKRWEAENPGEVYVHLNHEVGGAPYSACVEAMTEVALAGFNTVAKALHVSGFQASVAEMEFIRRSRHIKGPFGLYDLNDALYPQYDLVGRLRETLADPDTVKWLGDEAERLLAEDTKRYAAPRVREHWQALVAQRDAARKGS